jgi:hypothetical protein
MRDDQQRGVHVRGEPLLGVILRADRLPEPCHIGEVVEHQESPALGKACRRRTQAVADNPVN